MKRITVVMMAVLLVLLSISVGAQQSPTATKLVDGDTVWRYWEDGTDPASGSDRLVWTTTSFDDSAWKTNVGKKAVFGERNGTTDFGNGVTAPSVLLAKGKSAYFFRTKVTLSSANADYELSGTVTYGDAFVVYVNGKKIASNHEPDGGFANNLAYGGYTGSFPLTVSFQVDSSCLKQGENVVAVEVHRSSQDNKDVYFELSHLTLTERTIRQKAVSLSVGKNETERNVTWHTNLSIPAEVQYAEKKGEAFPSSFKVATAEVSKSQNDSGFYINRATLTQLKPNSEYVYRLVNGRFVSKTYSFKTDSTGDFSFLFTGDPQIGSFSHVAGWNAALETMNRHFPEARLLVTAGDQVNVADSEDQFEWYLQPSLMQYYVNMPVIGNHEATKEAFSEHFTHPNNRIGSKHYGHTKAGSNSWFTYNDVLFIHLNTSNTENAEHVEFVEKVVKQNANVKWKVVLLHHTLFSLEEGRWSSNDTLTRRKALAPVFGRLGIDVVLMGHDHTYVRTHMMDGLTPRPTDANYANKGDGVLYISGGSGSGSKYYDILPEADTSFVAKQWQGYSATFALVEVSDAAFAITTYKTDDMSVIDTFSLLRSGTKPPATVTQNKTTTASQTGQTVTAGNTTSSDSDSLTESTVTSVIEGVTTTEPAQNAIVTSTATQTASDAAQPQKSGWIVWLIAVPVLCGGATAAALAVVKKIKH